ncbi:MAG TPA: P-II family nitrogen regulator [Dehalococcoidia bacterium]|nr:P-II family nitrogen regulator [Dehalococcoidia bacterium]
MKMVQAIIRPDKEQAVSAALAKANFPALTKWDVVGRGKQQGIQVGSQIYDELAKSMVMIVVEDEAAERVVEIIQEAVQTGYTGDGKIFVAPVEEAYTIRTGKPEL